MAAIPPNHALSAIAKLRDRVNLGGRLFGGASPPLPEFLALPWCRRPSHWPLDRISRTIDNGLHLLRDPHEVLDIDFVSGAKYDISI